MKLLLWCLVLFTVSISSHAVHVNIEVDEAKGKEKTAQKTITTIAKTASTKTAQKAVKTAKKAAKQAKTAAKTIKKADKKKVKKITKEVKKVTKKAAKAAGHVSAKVASKIAKLKAKVSKLIKKDEKGMSKKTIAATKKAAQALSKHDLAELAHHTGKCVCNDSCKRAKDGICDDGRDGSLYSKLCAPGTDCSDCGPSTRVTLLPFHKCADLIGALVGPGPVTIPKQTQHQLAKASVKKMQFKIKPPKNSKKLSYGTNYKYGEGYTWPTHTATHSHTDTDTDTSPTDSFSVTATATESLSVAITVDDSMTTEQIARAEFAALHPPKPKKKVVKKVEKVAKKHLPTVTLAHDSPIAKLSKSSLKQIGNDMGSTKTDVIVSKQQ